MLRLSLDGLGTISPRKEYLAWALSPSTLIGTLRLRKNGTLALKLAAGRVANNPVPVLDRIESRRFTPQLAADVASHLASLSQLQITRLLTDEAIIEKTLIMLLPHPPSPS